MLSSFLSSTPQPVEELHWGNWIIIVIAFILYCASLTLVTYFFAVYDNYKDYDRWRHITHASIAVIFLLVPAWYLFRGYPGQWGGLYLFIPLVCGMISSYCVLNIYRNINVSIEDIPWSSLLGCGLVAMVCGVLDYISEKLASIPMSWGAFVVIVIGVFAWGASKD